MREDGTLGPQEKTIAPVTGPGDPGGYFPHIDGIRALAVLPVVLYHVLARLCPGGFAGVDVFFVISGYLITGGILRDLGRDRFSIKNFYHRRIRRILPAYFAMIIGVLLLGITFYYARPLVFLSNGITAGSLFFSNIFYWEMGHNYFSPELHSQALLHLWSLSVEEQFYVFIPFLCSVIWRIRRSWVAPFLGMLALASFLSAVVLTRTGGQNAAFYFLPFRAWELLAGSMLAMLPPLAQGGARGGRGKGRWAALAALGLLLVLVPYYTLSSRSVFPGLAAVAPVAGTALLIRHGQRGWVGRILSWDPLVLVGKLSFSLYLWHWPVTVFWRYVTYDQLRAADYAGMLLLSLVLGYLSWRFVELPVRTSASWRPRRSFVFALAGIGLLVTVGVAGESSRGWRTVIHRQANALVGAPSPVTFLSGRVEGLFRRLDGMLEPRITLLEGFTRRRNAMELAWGSDVRGPLGPPGPPRLLLMGDSHASSLQCGLDSGLRDRHIPAFTATWAGTPMYDLRRRETAAALAKLEASPGISTVLLAQYWTEETGAGDPVRAERNYACLEAFALRIQALGRRLVIAQDIPVHKHALDDIAARMLLIRPRTLEPEWRTLVQTGADYAAAQAATNARLAEICRRTGAELLPLERAFEEDGAYVYFGQENGQTVPYYRDPGHLTPAGSRRAARFILSRTAL